MATTGPPRAGRGAGRVALIVVGSLLAHGSPTIDAPRFDAIYGTRFPVVFALWNVPIASPSMVALALLMLLPVRQVVRLTGDALRHA
jgi:hypothetical protein